MLALSLVLILTVTLSVIGMVSIVKAVQTPVVAATFYCWFGYDQATGTWPGGFGTSHWGDKRTTTVSDHPLGYYSSLDNQTVRQQLSEIMVAGIDVVLVSWWNDYTTPCITNLFKYIETNNIQIKVAIIVEHFAGFTFPYATDLA